MRCCQRALSGLDLPGEAGRKFQRIRSGVDRDSHPLCPLSLRLVELRKLYEFLAAFRAPARIQKGVKLYFKALHGAPWITSSAMLVPFPSRVKKTPESPSESVQPSPCL